MDLSNAFRTLLVVLVPVCLASADDSPTLAYRSESVIDPAALNLAANAEFGEVINGAAFQRDALLSHAGWQYAAYYDAQRQVCVARRPLPYGAWQILRLPDYRLGGDNGHDTISLGISAADGRLHLSYSQHARPLRYRVSEPGLATHPSEHAWEPARFGPETEKLGAHRIATVTYPAFINTPDGGLLFGYRSRFSGDGDNQLARYDPVTGDWSESWTIDSGGGAFTDHLGGSKSRCAYLNGYDFGPDGKLHVTFCWREQAATPNHTLAYTYSEDLGRTWRTNDGARLAEPARIDTPGLAVWPIARDLGLMNQQHQTVDDAGRVHVLMWHCTPETLAAAGSAPGRERWGPPAARRYYHYWRSTDGIWKRNALPGAVGTRPRILADKNGDLYALAVVPDGENALARGVYVLHGRLVVYTAAAAWHDWRVLATLPRDVRSEPLFDVALWRATGRLDVLLQDTPATPGQASPLRVLTLALTP